MLRNKMVGIHDLNVWYTSRGYRLDIALGAEDLDDPAIEFIVVETSTNLKWYFSTIKGALDRLVGLGVMDYRDRVEFEQTCTLSLVLFAEFTAIGKGKELRLSLDWDQGMLQPYTHLSWVVVKDTMGYMSTVSLERAVDYYDQEV